MQLFVAIYLFSSCKTASELQIITVATEANDGFRRFEKSIKNNNLNLKVLGMGSEWLGGNMLSVGGGYKINLLKKAMEELKDEKDIIVMFTDSYDVIITGNSEEILNAFQKMEARVIFSAEGFCWPDSSLANKYPEVKINEKRFLNSGGFIGYAKEIYEIVSAKSIENTYDDQLYYTEIFLDESMRERLSIKLDKRSEIFQNLHGALDEAKVKFKGKKSYLNNIMTGSIPIVIHGNGPIKPHFNSLTNYLGDAWTPKSGCLSCLEDTISLADVKDEDKPKVLISVHIDHPTPFIEDFFDRLTNLTYPKNKIDLLIHYIAVYNTKDVNSFLEHHGPDYHSVQVVRPEDAVDITTGRNKGLDACVQHDCKYYFALDGEAQIENINTLQLLIERNRSVVAPMMIRPGKMWSTFWGALNSEGFYKRSEDYADLVSGKKIGLWNVPHVSQAVLLQRYVVDKVIEGYSNSQLDPDMALCKSIREKGFFMFVDNQDYYGHLVSADNFKPAYKHDELYEIMENQYTWEKKYIHPNYYKELSKDYENLKPCTDVYWMQVATPTFCWHLIEEMEHYGKWSGGKDNFKDERLAGGYENVPTVDIHTNQIQWETHWLYMLKSYIAPLAEKVFTGYHSDARAMMNFVVRYRPGEQDSLRPHHDSSTYTINMALNRVNVDYEGGGVRFLRYNCRVTALRQGWILMHPGRLTHQHEGLRTTNGTRYIMVSFVDP